MSPLGCEYSQGGKRVEVQIYRAADESEWILEVEDEYGNSTVWDVPFDTDQLALDEFLAKVKTEGLDSFIGPFDE